MSADKYMIHPNIPARLIQKCYCLYNVINPETFSTGRLLLHPLDPLFFLFWSQNTARFTTLSKVMSIRHQERSKNSTLTIPDDPCSSELKAGLLFYSKKLGLLSSTDDYTIDSPDSDFRCYNVGDHS